MTQEQLLELVAHNTKYNAYVYNQISTLTQVWDGDYKIEYLYEKLPDNCLLFMVPNYTSKATDNKLTIRYLTGTKKNPDGSLSGIYKSRTYTIYVETIEGKLTKAKEGDIVAHRLAIFRFIKGDNDSVILINSPLYNSISLSTLTVTNDAKFYKAPVVIDRVLGTEVPLATNTDVLALAERVTKLENKFIYGSKDAEEALAKEEIGTIYLKVEEGE